MGSASCVVEAATEGSASACAPGFCTCLWPVAMTSAPPLLLVPLVGCSGCASRRGSRVVGLFGAGESCGPDSCVVLCPTPAPCRVSSTTAGACALSHPRSSLPGQHSRCATSVLRSSLPPCSPSSRGSRGRSSSTRRRRPEKEERRGCQPGRRIGSPPPLHPPCCSWQHVCGSGDRRP